MLSQAEFRARYGPAALVLGGSEGIGRQFAEELAARGLDLVLVARRAAALAAAAEELRARHRVVVATQVCDLADPAPAELSAAALARHDVGLVVCNAGATHGVGAFLDAPLEKALRLVQLNCLTPLTVAHRVLARRRGRGGGLILISSMSAVGGSGLIATYAAAKAFEITLAQGLHWELAREGIDVLCAVAGLTDTPAMRNSGLSFSAAGARGYTAMSAAAVAQGALEHLGRRAVWYAVGEEALRALRSLPPEQLTAAMSEATAAMYEVPLS